MIPVRKSSKRVTAGNAIKLVWGNLLAGPSSPKQRFDRSSTVTFPRGRMSRAPNINPHLLGLEEPVSLKVKRVHTRFLDFSKLNLPLMRTSNVWHEERA